MKIVTLLALLSGVFLHSLCQAKITYPKETVLLELPEKGEMNWKEIKRVMNERKVRIEMIPLDQRPGKWSELIGIQFFDRSVWDQKQANTVEAMVERLKTGIITSFRGKQITWNIIDKNEDDILYEWYVTKPNKNDRPEHEIVRAFLTDAGFHKVGFTQIKKKLTPEQREKWIKLLRENVSVVPWKKAEESVSLSLVDQTGYSIDLGLEFKEWYPVGSYVNEFGYTNAAYCPKKHFKEAFVKEVQSGATEMAVPLKLTECLEVVTSSLAGTFNLKKSYQREKNIVQGKTIKRVQFEVLEKSPEEMIFTYVQPIENDLFLNGMVRIFNTEHGYYSIGYKHAMEGKMSKDEIMQWKDRLKTIQVAYRAKSTQETK